MMKANKSVFEGMKERGVQDWNKIKRWSRPQVIPVHRM